jgi:hypothetical protein
MTMQATNTVEIRRAFCSPSATWTSEKGVGAIAFANANRDDFLLSRRLVDLDMHMMDLVQIAGKAVPFPESSEVRKEA